MAFHTPHGSARFRLPWSWSSFDYRTLCQELFAQTDARFEIAKVEGRTGNTVHTDRGDLTAPLIIDALGWKRVLADAALPAARRADLAEASRSTRTASRPTSTCGSTARLVRYGYAWSVPAEGEQRIGVGSYEPTPPRQGADEGDRAAAGTGRRPLPGQLVPAPAAARDRGRRVLRRRQRRALHPAVGRGHPHRVLLRDRGRARDRARRSTASRPRDAGARQLRAASAAATHPPTRSRCSFSTRSRACRRRRSPQLLRLMGRERLCRTHIRLVPHARAPKLRNRSNRSMRQTIDEGVLSALVFHARPGLRRAHRPARPRRVPRRAARRRRPRRTASPCCSWTSTTSRSSTTASGTRPATGC